MPESPYTASLARQIVDFRDLLATTYRQPEELTADLVMSTTGRMTTQHMSRIVRDAFGQSDSRLEDDPYGGFLAEGLTSIRNRALALAASPTNELPAVVCCIVGGMYLFSEDFRDSAENLQRQVRESDFVAWLHVLREVLFVMRDLTEDTGFGAQLSILTKDIAAAIEEAILSVAVAPVIVMMVMLEWVVNQMFRWMTEQVVALRCPPLIELWGAMLGWLFNPHTGLMRRMEAWTSQIFSHMARSIEMSNFFASGELPSDAVLRFDWQRLTQIIQAIDQILAMTDVFRFCRIPVADTTPATTTTVPTTPPRPDRPPRNDQPPTGGDTGTPFTPPPGGGGGGGGGADPWVVPPGETGVRAPLDPSTFRNPPGPGDGYTTKPGYLFLTPENMQTALVRMGLTWAEARRYTQGPAGTCRDQVSPETASILDSIGI